MRKGVLVSFLDRRNIRSAARFCRSWICFATMCALSVVSVILTSRMRTEWGASSHYPASLCGRSRTEVVVVIRSSPVNLARRDAIRRTMAHPAVQAALPAWEFLFYTGWIKDSGVMNGVHHEISSHGDILVAPFKSSPNNSVEILLDVMRWVAQRCAKPRPLRLFVHTNDTVFVDVITLESYSWQLDKTDRPSFYCKPVRGVEVGRDPERANYVPRHLFRGPVFPPYCEGDAFFINGSQLASLHRASLYALHYALVPQYVTGHMAVLADMGHVDVSQRMADVGGVVGDPAAEPNLFVSGMPLKAWTDVWLRSLYNQTRHAALEKSLTEMILAGLKAVQN